MTIFYSDNEGHIFVKLTNDSNEGKTVSVEQGTGMVQGIFMQYGVTIDDDVTEVRNGGFGSTTKTKIEYDKNDRRKWKTPIVFGCVKVMSFHTAVSL